ncbi:MAG: hypothetical protein M3Z84_07405 [Actinomycetota bacterium]|nr:hypothetical protein [Actinomycetota bacterium]
MARIRSMKPELWHSVDFLDLSFLGRLMFLCLISQADDAGRMKAGAAHLVQVYFGGADVAEVEAQLEVMHRRGMLVRYVVDGVDCMQLTNFLAHQKIDKPSPSRIPPPPNSPRVRRGVGERSSIVRARARAGIGSDRRGSEGSVPDLRAPAREAAPSPAPAPAPPEAGRDDGLMREQSTTTGPGGIPPDVDRMRVMEILDFFTRFHVQPLTGADLEHETAIAIGMARLPGPTEKLLPVIEKDWLGYLKRHPGAELKSLNFFAESWEVASSAWLKAQRPATSRGGNATRLGDIYAGKGGAT